MIQLIGMEEIKPQEYYRLYFRDERGFKYKVCSYEGFGFKDLFMCSGVPRITLEEYNLLPEKIEP